MRAHHVSKYYTTCFSQGELHQVEVQTLLRPGIPRFDIIGLPKSSLREGKDRILAALSSLGISLPSQKILVNLKPGDLPKEGSHFDLPILMGILSCLGILVSEKATEFYWGELQLDGEIRPVEHLMNHLLYANFLGSERNGANLSSLPRNPLDSIIFNNSYSLQKVSEILEPPQNFKAQENQPHNLEKIDSKNMSDWVDTTDESNSKWNQLEGSLEQHLFWSLVSLGRHHVLVEGSPGVGKSTWCQALKELQRPLPHKLWMDKIRNIRLENTFESLRERSFEMPHHSSSMAAVIGGGSGSVQMGAISRANQGILFLDELPEFSRNVLESLREPLENKSTTIARSRESKRLPADIQLLAAMNPCPCGYHESKKRCVCPSARYLAYKTKISGPLRERFDWNLIWRFKNQKPPKAFRLKEVRARLVELEEKRALPEWKISKIPEELNPRRLNSWNRRLIDWARFHDESSLTNETQERFQRFCQQLEVRSDARL